MSRTSRRQAIQQAAIAIRMLTGAPRSARELAEALGMRIRAINRLIADLRASGGVSLQSQKVGFRVQHWIGEPSTQKANGVQQVKRDAEDDWE